MSAGGLIFRRRGSALELFFIKDPYQRWTFPKGHQEPGETMEQTAIREIEEETGLTGLRLIGPVGRTLFRFRREGTLIEKTVHFFLFEAHPDARERITGEEGIEEALWVPVYRAFDMSGYRNLDRLLSKALRMIAEDERREKARGAQYY